MKLTGRQTATLLPAGRSPPYLHHVDVGGAAGDRVVHLPHLAVRLHGNESDGHGEPPTCENGRVHHLGLLETDREGKKQKSFTPSASLLESNDLTPSWMTFASIANWSFSISCRKKSRQLFVFHARNSTLAVFLAVVTFDRTILATSARNQQGTQRHRGYQNMSSTSGCGASVSTRGE